jgi:hypothetical protein
MKRTTVSLPDDLAAALAREARRRDRSASDITREALERHLGLGGELPRDIPFAAIGRSGQPTTGRDMEDLIDREWGSAARGR